MFIGILALALAVTAVVRKSGKSDIPLALPPAATNHPSGKESVPDAFPKVEREATYAVKEHKPNRLKSQPADRPSPLDCPVP